MMMRRKPSSIRLYISFVALTTGVSLLVGLVGYWPTARLGGSGAVSAMFAGCGVSLVGSLLGAIPFTWARRDSARDVSQAILLSTALRFLAVILLAVSLALSGWFQRVPLLVWVAISYLVLLMVDTGFAVRVSGSAEASGK